MTLSLLAGLAATAQANVYRWRDSQGAVHYDQSLPDKAIASGYEVLDDAGDVVKRVPPPSTASQRAEARRKAAVAERLATQKETQRRQDRMLLQTFDNVGEIKNMRDQRLKALGVQIELARDRIKQLSGGGSSPEQAAAQTDLTTLLKQRLYMRQEFAQDIQRFRELQKGEAQ